MARKQNRATEFREWTGAKDDRYYMRHTYAAVAVAFINQVMQQYNFDYDRIEDPCAGDGAMSHHFPEGTVDNFDLNPSHSSVIQRDFLLHNPEYDSKLVYIMNVPYGRNSAAAIEFFNHGAKHARYIAIVVPYTWHSKGQTSGDIFHKLNPHMHLVATHFIDKNAFYLPDNNNKIHDVPSVLMIWERRDELRIDPPIRTDSLHFDVCHNYGTALTKRPDYILKRSGCSAGTLLDPDDYQSIAPQTALHIYIKPGKWKQKIMDIIESTDWCNMKEVINMAQRSINKTLCIQTIEGQM